MIRHARAACILVLALPILTRPVAMVEPSLRTLLVPAIGTASLIEPGLLATSQAAITLPTVTMRTKKE
jgi:hypothetical protein